MKCPFCGEFDTKVIDTRNSAEFEIRRRRECPKCGKRFTTYEKIETIPFFVVKKDKTREIFDKTKIEKGIIQSCIKRPISAETISNLVSEIEKEIYSLEKSEIESTVIGELVLNKLKMIDKVAYVRFASVYKDFKEVSNFGEEVSKIYED